MRFGGRANPFLYTLLFLFTLSFKVSSYFQLIFCCCFYIMPKIWVPLLSKKKSFRKHPLDSSIPRNIHPGQLPLTYPHVKFNRQRESKKKNHIGILANSLSVKFSLKSWTPGNFLLNRAIFLRLFDYSGVFSPVLKIRKFLSGTKPLIEKPKLNVSFIFGTSIIS